MNGRIKVLLGGFRVIPPFSAVLIIWCVSVRAQTLDFSGQASGWITANHDDTRIGLRYIPELSLIKRFSGAHEISVEVAANAWGFRRYQGWNDTGSASAVDPYRLWIRFASPQVEARAGLQKISFGSATLLRPLMWFDSIDPRDPLQLTDGVYALLGRYFFLNNANIWAWSLYGNDGLKGWETLAGDDRKIEFGGRVQIPVPAGEMGLSYHRRHVDPKGSGLGARYPAQGTFPEQRIGLDGKWDIGVGLWFEGTATRQDFDVPDPKYRRILMAGMDYTFGVGNGLHLLGEHLERAETMRIAGSGGEQSISALTGDYPLGLLDAVSAIVYYDWNNDEWWRFLAWRRTYDRWQIHANAFWNPGRTSLNRNTAESGSFAGSGAKLVLVFNH